MELYYFTAFAKKTLTAGSDWGVQYSGSQTHINSTYTNAQLFVYVYLRPLPA